LDAEGPLDEAHCGSALQDDIDRSTRQLLKLGEDILGRSTADGLKRVICAERVRQVPAQFSWLDHRLVRDRHIDRCDPHAAMLYLFLVTVADAQGLSWYADESDHPTFVDGLRAPAASAR
jgi:hypothetical protein